MFPGQEAGNSCRGISHDSNCGYCTWRSKSTVSFQYLLLTLRKSRSTPVAALRSASSAGSCQSVPATLAALVSAARACCTSRNSRSAAATAPPAEAIAAYHALQHHLQETSQLIMRYSTTCWSHRSLPCVTAPPAGAIAAYHALQHHLQKPSQLTMSYSTTCRSHAAYHALQHHLQEPHSSPCVTATLAGATQLTMRYNYIINGSTVNRLYNKIMAASNWHRPNDILILDNLHFGTFFDFLIVQFNQNKGKESTCTIYHWLYSC